MSKPAADDVPEYGLGWRLKSAALSVGGLAWSVLVVRVFDLPLVFAAPGIIPAALLLSASFAPEWELVWRGRQRRGAWQIAGTLAYPLIYLIFTAYALWAVIGASGWARSAAIAVSLSGAVLTVHTLRHGLAWLDDPGAEGDR